MKALLQLWKTRVAVWQARKRDSHGESELSLEQELLLPISQLYGFEYFPSVHRYHEKWRALLSLSALKPALSRRAFFRLWYSRSGYG